MKHGNSNCMIIAVFVVSFIAVHMVTGFLDAIFVSVIYAPTNSMILYK